VLPLYNWGIYFHFFSVTNIFNFAHAKDFTNIGNFLPMSLSNKRQNERMFATENVTIILATPLKN